jgi:molybdopterin converting factor small subunit
LGAAVQVTVKLGSLLRDKAPHFRGGEGTVSLPDQPPATVADVMAALHIAPEEVNVIYRNHVFVGPAAPVDDGDRVALFPPNFIHFSQFYLKRQED